MLSAVTLLGLAGIIAVSLIGPLLAAPRRYAAPIVVGELAIGVVLGTTGLRVIHPNDPILSFLAQAGFGLVMLIAGSHVPIGNRALHKAAGRGLLLVIGTGIVAVPVAAALSSLAHTHHTALYAVLLSSSSAAVIMPIIDGEGLTGDRVLTLMAQVAIADTACIIALPLAADPSKAGRAAVGAVIVLAVAGLFYLILRELADRDLITKLQKVSIRHSFGLEMRVSLAALFALAGLAVNVHVSVMLAGFAFGLALSAIGTPRRLAGQLFAVTEGFLGPIFFIWLGASVDLRALAHHPRLVVLALGLAVATSAIHALARLAGQPLPLAVLATAQLGVPVAAAALGAQSGLLQPGEGGAILGAAVLTLIVAAVSGAYAKRPANAGRLVRAGTLAPAEMPATANTHADGVGDLAAAAVTAASPATPSAIPPTPPTPAAAATEAAVPAVAARPAGPRKRPAARPQAAVASVKTATPPGPLATPNPATKPIVQSNVRIQPAPQRPERTPPARPRQTRPTRSDDDS
jgi:Kef-type K+ transport system membrane component KefB